ncbi:hypothetical protein EDD21DRAFT_371342 [Dissophora ornata]|nr:hypothetical protein BGZ58_001176 [Dissophora ornata]KAI8602611.1 hypothetical protein EDD21DRAFT_371342 [Dissophora ornata]
MASIQEKIAAALVHKDQGNESYKQGDMKGALTEYHLTVLALSGLDNQMSGMAMMSLMSSMAPQKGAVSDSQKSEIKTNLAVVYANMAACHLKSGNYKRAIDVCNSALKSDPDNVKAKFRRGQAKLQDGNLAGAEADFESLGEKVPGVKAELDKLKKKSKEAEEKQRKTMGGFLSRGRISTAEDEQEENEKELSAAASSGTPSKTVPKSKPTLASKINSANSQSRKPKASEEEEYTPTWSGTAPKIQELADGEE